MEEHILLFGFDLITWATIALVLATAALVYYTRIMAEEGRKTRQQSIEPNIVVTIEPYEHALFHAFLIIENVGSGIAYDIKIREVNNHKFKNDNKEFQLNDLAFMNLKILKSGQKLKHHLGTFQELPSKVFEFSILSSDVSKRQVTNTNIVDVGAYYDIEGFRDKGIEEFVRSFEKFEANFASIISGFRRLNIDTFSQENREQEKAKRDASRQK